MKTSTLKHIDVVAKEWFDKVNGNSYFSIRITLESKGRQWTVYVPFQYGYGDHYKDVAFDEIRKQCNCFKACKGITRNAAYKKYGIRVRHEKHENQLQRNVKTWGKILKEVI